MKLGNLFKKFNDISKTPKMTIPEENQKQMMEFFMRTSILRIKVKKEKSPQKAERKSEIN